MSRARELSRLGNPNIIAADSAGNVGFGITTPKEKVNVVGVVSATSFYGDGSTLDGIASAGIGTALSDDKTKALNTIYYTNNEVLVNTTSTINPPDSGHIAYTQAPTIVIEDTKEITIADGDDLLVDVLGISTGVNVDFAARGNGVFGNIYVDNIWNQSGQTSVNFPKGLVSSGVATFTSDVSIGGTLTYEDVKNVDSVGLITARTGIRVTGGDVGIGIDNPDSLLHISKGTNADDGAVTFTIGGSAVNTRQSTITKNNVGSNNRPLEIRAATGASHETIKFFSDATTERLRIGAAGQVGLSGANYGTSGQVMTSQGASAAPQWADAGGGAWEVINDISMGADYGSHEMDITGFTTSYTQYRVNMNNLNFVGGGNKKLYVRFYIDGTLYTTQTYGYNSIRRNWATTGNYNAGEYNIVAWRLQGDSAAKNWCGEFHIPMHMNPTANPLGPRCTVQQLTTHDYWGEEGCASGSAAGGQITGLKIYNGTDTTNFGLSGRVTTYGLKYS
jgi:hypothetical protein